jgi:hypothetical protein
MMVTLAGSNLASAHLEVTSGGITSTWRVAGRTAVPSAALATRNYYTLNRLLHKCFVHTESQWDGDRCERLYGRLRGSRGEEAQLARRRLLIENATDRLVFDRYVAPKTEAARLQQRYRTHRDSLYVFLHRDDVEPTNNSSERDLRPSVIHRKVIGGFRSAWGAEASAIRSSILATARKQGQNLLDAFRAVAGPSPLQAVATPPDLYVGS